jgi:hypothetical protein
MSTRKKWITALGLLAIPAAILVGLFRLGVISISTPATDENPPVDLTTLTALPYTNFVVEQEERKQKTGVMLYDEALAYPGVNLYCNHFNKTTGAFLINMKGRVLHQWQTPDNSKWSLVTVDESGNVYGVLHKGKNARLVKMGWNSNVLFEVPGMYHHDICLLDDGSIVTLRREKRATRYKRRAIYIMDDYLVHISPDGRILKEKSLFQVLRNESFLRKIFNKVKSDRSHAVDLLHTNTSDVLDRDIPGFCRKGNVLLCMRNLDLILVYDYEVDEIVWRYRGDGVWQHPHEPKLLQNGNLLIFDNGYKRGWSRVIEIDPITKQIVWEYKGSPTNSFFTEARGSIQRFPNGNTLITESDTGRVFEITRDGKLVWEWYNPLFSNEGRLIVYKMKRLEPDIVNTWLAKAGQSQTN